MSEANRTFGRGSGNIANPSKSENCQGNFRDLQKDLVVLRDLMLLLPLRRLRRQLSYEESLFVGRGRRLNVCEANFTLS